MTHQAEDPTDHRTERLIVAVVRFAAEAPGVCARCGTIDRARRATQTAYLAIPSAEKRASVDAPEAVQVDRYLRQLLDHQRRGEFTVVDRRLVCGACAAHAIDAFLQIDAALRIAHGDASPKSLPPHAGTLLLARSHLTPWPVFVALCYAVEPGVEGHILPHLVYGKGQPDLAFVLRAHALTQEQLERL